MPETDTVPATEEPKKSKKKWFVRATFEAPYAIQINGVQECTSPAVAIRRFLQSKGVREKLIKPGKKTMRKWHKLLIVIEPYKD